MLHSSLRKKLMLILAALAVAGVPLTAPASVENLESKAVYGEIRKDLQAIQYRLKSIPKGVLSGEAKPGWEDFDKLEKILNTILAIKAKVKDRPEAQIELASLTRDLREVMLSVPEIKERFDARSAYAQNDKYAPTEFELKMAFQLYLARINRELPEELRIPLKKLPQDPRHEWLLKEAREFAAKSRESFVARFETSGFKSYADYETYLRSLSDPRIKKAIKVIEKDQIQPIIRRPENARFWVPKVGFQNQFVTGSSLGTYSPYGRNRGEANLYQVDTFEDYSRRDPEFKPKYGTLIAKPEAGAKNDRETAYWYGEDIYALKTEAIADRLTFFPGDSLQPAWQEYPGQTRPWIATVIPWSFRLLMVPFFAHAVDQRVDSSDSGSRFFTSPSLSVVSELSMPLKTNGYDGGSYWEIQILGPVSLDDVKYFVFQSRPPEGEFLRELRIRHIPIFDGRSEPPQPWKEGP